MKMRLHAYDPEGHRVAPDDEWVFGESYGALVEQMRGHNPFALTGTVHHYMLRVLEGLGSPVGLPDDPEEACQTFIEHLVELGRVELKA